MSIIGRKYYSENNEVQKVQAYEEAVSDEALSDQGLKRPNMVLSCSKFPQLLLWVKK